MCRKHYSRWQRLGDPHPELDQPRRCDGCAETFTPRRTDQRFCTKACLSRTVTRRSRGLIEVISPIRACLWCETEFRHTDGRRLYCTEDCAKVATSLHDLPNRYGIGIKDFRRMWLAQGGLCAICRQPQVAYKFVLCVDHCHDTGRIRGLLCNNCNTALGLLQDSPAVIRAAASYLEAVS